MAQKHDILKKTWICGTFLVKVFICLFGAEMKEK